jgi:hypothetical protein
MFDNFTLGDFIFAAVVTIGTALIVYFASQGRKG